jgi:ATPase subunit of ABC transporter with duplicated ATPase domains
LDEPTNHLDLETVVAFEQALQGFTGALMAVSHDEAFLQAIQPSHYLSWYSTGWRLEPV